MSAKKTIWRLAYTSTRLAMFLVSGAFSAYSIWLIWAITKNDHDFTKARVDIDDSTFEHLLIFLNVFMLKLSVAGILAAFFGQRDPFIVITLFAFLVPVSLIGGSLLVICAQPSFKTLRRGFETNLRAYQKQYDWTQIPDSIQYNSTWDSIQCHSHCCGLAGPDDWAEFRPKNLDDGVLPMSCCSDAFTTSTTSNSTIMFAYCDPSQPHWTGGCLEAADGVFAMMLHMVYASILFNAIMGLLGALLMSCRSRLVPYQESSSAHLGDALTCIIR